MAITKQPYELSVWSEKLNDDGIKEEIFGAIIGGHDMTFLGRATQVKLKRELKGTNTLTFQMPSKYFDSQVGDYVHNELVDLIHNETKIKLKFGEDWYEFYVKKITENKKFKALMISYSCEDAFIDELSRTGYEIEFASDLNNSVAETGDFMEDILDMSIWDYTPEHNVGDFTEFNENRFYKIPLEQFGGSITGYKIKLEVKLSMMFDADGIPNDYLLRYLHGLHDEENFDEICKMMEYTYDEDDIGTSTMTFDTMTDEQYSFIENLLTIYNIFTDDERMIEFGDDLARERELFWDPYYKDNGIDLLSDENKYTLTGDYIYVPITDLSMIMGSIYEDAYTAVEEPARYGSYGDEDLGYALQPSSENPRDFVQFIFLDDGDVFNIDEEDVLCDNDFHYVIPIEEWNELLKAQLGDKDDVIYWKQVVPTTSTSVTLTTKYSYDGPDDDGYMWTTDAMPSSSTIDDFTWYPVYYEGYLTQIGDTDVTQARKISVTDRTEYNAEADMFVTVYNNKSNEYILDEYDDNGNQLTLYSDDELAARVLNHNENQPNGDTYGDTEFRVCSKLNTRQILPTLAANLVENGTEITDTNGWEARIQNRNNESITGTGSYASLLSLAAQSTIVQGATETEVDKSVTIEDYTIDGTSEDESISDYFLEITSPVLVNCIDFSKEGSVEIDYALNFGIISQEKEIEKDKIYALRLKTGDMKITGVAFSYRGEPTLDDSEIIIKYTRVTDNEVEDQVTDGTYEYILVENEDGVTTEVEKYKNLFKTYQKLFAIFQTDDEENAKVAWKNLTSREWSGNNKEIYYFYEMISRWPTGSDLCRSDKIALVDALLTAILFGGEAKIWTKDNVFADDEESISTEDVKLTGLVNIYDNLISGTKTYEKLSSIAVKETTTTSTSSYSEKTTTSTSYSNSDIKYLKFYLLWHLTASQEEDISVSASLSATGTQLTNAIISTWVENYILYDKIFEEKINSDLDKIVIGKGSVDLEGNYTIQGGLDKDTGEINSSDTEYIGFSELFEEDRTIKFLPDNTIDSIDDDFNATTLQSSKYHIGTRENEHSKRIWSWSENSVEELTDDDEYKVVAIEDSPFLLFKANKTITNPYIGIKVESNPLEIVFDEIIKTNYGYDYRKGIQINISDNENYYDDVTIKLTPVNSTTCSEDFLKLIGFDYEEYYTFDTSLTNIEWDEDYLLSSTGSWIGTSSLLSPAFCSTFLKNKNEDCTFPYLVFINSEFQGILYLNKKQQGGDNE